MDYQRFLNLSTKTQNNVIESLSDVALSSDGAWTICDDFGSDESLPVHRTASVASTRPASATLDISAVETACSAYDVTVAGASQGRVRSEIFPEVDSVDLHTRNSIAEQDSASFAEGDVTFCSGGAGDRSKMTNETEETARRSAEEGCDAGSGTLSQVSSGVYSNVTPVDLYHRDVPVKRVTSSFNRGDANKHYAAIAGGDVKYNGNATLFRGDRSKQTAKVSLRTKNKQIIDVYSNNANKVSNTSVPFARKSSSLINRQSQQRETDRKNFILMKKLLHVKASVSTFR